MSVSQLSTDRPNGGIIAAVLAAGLACAVLGVCVVLTEASPAVEDVMNLWEPAGPLTGKTTVPTIVYLLAWPLLHWRLRQRDLDVRRSVQVTLGLVGVGLLGTFPLFYGLFAAGG
jgi:hypothetical protein